MEQTEGIIGAEALVRWQHPLRGLLTPAAFIAQAEHAGLIHTLDKQELAQACAQLAPWADTTEFTPLRLSVNLRGHLLSQDNFVAEVHELRERRGASQAQRTLDLTDNQIMDNTPR